MSRTYTPVWDSHGTENIGQKVGMPRAVKAHDSALGITVIVATHRSSYKNELLAKELLDIAAADLPAWDSVEQRERNAS